MSKAGSFGRGCPDNYGVSADVSIGRLFLAGAFPGVLMGSSLMTLVRSSRRDRACAWRRAIDEKRPENNPRPLCPIRHAA